MRAIGAADTRRATYAAISAVAAREMRLASLLARRFRSARHSGQSSPQPRPRTRRSHLAQGTSGSPPGDSTAKLLSRCRPAQIAGADLVLNDGSSDGVPDTLGPIELTD